MHVSYSDPELLLNAVNTQLGPEKVTKLLLSPPPRPPEIQNLELYNLVVVPLPAQNFEHATKASLFPGAFKRCLSIANSLEKFSRKLMC